MNNQRYQFSLRTLLLVTTGVACVMGFLMMLPNLGGIVLSRMDKEGPFRIGWVALGLTSYFLAMFTFGHFLFSPTA